MKPLFTAFISNYNYSDYIVEAIDSVFSQTLFDSKLVEIIIVDDGSSDLSPLKICRYRDRLSYVYKKNAGVSSCWNMAFQLSRGDYFCVLDADDVWFPGKLERLEMAARHKPAVIYHRRAFFDNNCVTSHDFRFVSGNLLRDRRRRLMYRGVGGTQLAFRRDVLEKIGPIPGFLRFMPDGYYQFIAPFYGEVVGIETPLSRYRCHPASVYSSQGRGVIKERAKILIRALEAYYINNGFNRFVYRDFIDTLRFAMISSGRSGRPFPRCITENLRILRHMPPAQSLPYKLLRFVTPVFNRSAAAKTKELLFRREN